MDYYDIDDILLQDEPVPIVTLCGASGFGFLDQENRDDVTDLDKDRKVNLPLWLADYMAKLRRVKFELPRTHGQLIRNELKANPASVSMKGNQYFYEVGLGYLRGLKHNPRTEYSDADLRPLMKATFGGRFPELIDRAQNWRGRDTYEVTEAFTKTEQRLFEAGYQSSLQVEEWLKRKESPLEAGAVVQTLRANAKKRKRQDL